MKWWFVIAGLFTFQAEAVEFESGAKQKVMIELFTSQGCSSCPPAEEYLNSLTSHKELWSKYIPIALHVDYWDHLGWKDKFAKSQHSSRQREYARVTRARTVFTPAFFVNGKNWRPGFLKKAPAPVQPIVGNLKVKLKGKKVYANFSGHEKALNNLQMNVAIAGMELRTQIKRGENAGRFSKHSFVLLGYTKLVKNKSGGWSGRLPKVKILDASKYAIVAWVSRSDSPAPIQAVGGYLSRTAYPTAKVLR